MLTIRSDAIADMFFQINWSSSGVQHTEAYAGLFERLGQAQMKRIT